MTTPTARRAERRPRPAARSRLFAVAALLALAAAFIAAVALLADHLGDLLIVVLGLCIAVAGGWWAVAERMPRRAVGIGVAVVGLGVIVAGVVDAFRESDAVLVRIAILVALLAVAAAAGREAVLGVETGARGGATPAAPTRVGIRHPVLLCNPWSGGGKVERFGLVPLAHSMGVETVLLDRGLDLEALARDAIARGADCLGMAGGDGSQALVASIAVEHGLPFVCVSAGTRNHFALDLGLRRDDPRLSMEAFRDRVERRVDYATVNDRFFVNNVSLGVYATIVQEESYRDAKVATSRDLLPEMLSRTSEPFDLQFTTPGGEQVDGAILVMISNNPYVLGASPDAAQRRTLESGQLGVFAVTTRTGAEAARLMAASAVGLRRRSGSWHEFAAPTFEVRSRSGTALAGVDGEALVLGTPLRFAIHPRGLRLLVPAGNLEVARARETRQARVRDVFAIAAGRAD